MLRLCDMVILNLGHDSCNVSFFLTYLSSKNYIVKLGEVESYYIILKYLLVIMILQSTTGIFFGINMLNILI